jgi:hypothetical protein
LDADLDQREADHGDNKPGDQRRQGKAQFADEKA